MPAVARYAWAVLAYTVAVIGWGAYVRATGSGAGCGAHWPLCNGEVLPRSPELATIIELSHRVTSGISLLAVVGLLVWTFRAHRRGHPARTGAGLSMFFMLAEAAVGAGLVLFELVADNATMARAMFMMVHLMNTFLLLGAMTLTAWWLTGGARLTGRRAATVTMVVVGCLALLMAGASGAVAALGDTLFPASSLGEALSADLSPGSHLLIRLRVLHPLLAVAAALLVAVLAPRLARGNHGLVAPRVARVMTLLLAVQVAVGLLNVALLAPVWLQLVHLGVADAIWIAFVLLGAEALADTPSAASAARAA